MSCINDARIILGAEKDEGITEVARRRMAELAELRKKVEAYEALGIDALKTLAEFSRPKGLFTTRQAA
jgi:hypothetical protein